MLVDHVRLERLIQRLGVGPAHHLMLQLRIGQAVEEFAEAVDLVALGDDDENREADVQDALDDIELLGDLAGLFLRSGRRNP